MPPDPIARVRRFNRAVTSEVGALDTSFLGRGRPLGAARVLNAIGHGHSDVAAIRDYLGLDSGLMSRLLRGLEEEGLVSSAWDAASPGPAKRRYAITPAGTRLLDQWVEALRRSQERTARFLDRYERGKEVN